MRRNQARVLLLIIILAGFALRVFRLDLQSLWYDEAFSVYLAQFSLTDITARTAADIQPPLYYYVLHFWMLVAGDREFAVRFLSLVFGVLTIPLLYATTRRLFEEPAARLTTALAVLSPLYIWYSQETRMYTLITFLLLLSSYLLVRALEASNGRAPLWTAFALVNAAAVYTHYFAFVIIAFQALYTLFRIARTRWQGWRSAFLSFAAVSVAFLPWTPFVVARLGQDASYWQGALKLDEALRHILINFTAGESVLEGVAQWIAAGWMAILVIGLAAWAVRTRLGRGGKAGPVLFALLYLLVPLILLLFLFYRNPKFNARYLMIASPAFFILLGVGLYALVSSSAQRNRWARAAAVALSAVAGAFLLSTSLYADANAYFDPAFTKASFRDVARYVESHIAPGEAVLLTSGHLFPAFDYYYRGSAPQIRLPDDPTLNTDHVIGYDAANVLNQTLANARGVWVVLWQDEVVDPNGFIPMLLSSAGRETKIADASFYQVRLRHWTFDSGVRVPAAPEPGTARAANFKDKVALLGFDAPTPTPADTGASFNLYYQALDASSDDYQVALRVRDAAGNLWGKQDRRPAGYNYPTTRWKKGEALFGAYTVPLLAGAPAGNYFVEVNFYAASDPSGLDVLAPNGAPVGKTVKVGPIPVLPAAQPASYAALNIQSSVSQTLGPFTLLGYQLGREKASAGEAIPLTLFWRADSKPDKDYRFRLWLGSSPTALMPLANAQFPTSQWRAGETVRGQYLIEIPPDAAAGMQEIKLSLDWGTDAGQALVLAPFAVEKTDRVFVEPNVTFAQRATFGSDYLALVGYDAPATARAGDSMIVSLVWQARGKMDKPYTEFIHLLDKDGKVVAQKDGEPVNGTRPTSGWVANEYITDIFNIPVKADVPPGTYQIEIGWYDAKDPAFARLAALDAGGAPAGDHIILQSSIGIR